MLVLMRRVGETVKIGDMITITVLAVCHGNRIRIGIDAPRNIPVHREEIYERIKSKVNRIADEDESDEGERP